MYVHICVPIMGAVVRAGHREGRDVEQRPASRSCRGVGGAGGHRELRFHFAAARDVECEAGMVWGLNGCRAATSGKKRCIDPTEMERWKWRNSSHGTRLLIRPDVILVINSIIY